MTSRTSGRSPGNSRPGFTLLELMIAVVVIVILAAILIPLVIQSQSRAKRTKMAADLQAIASALSAYKTDFGDYPRLPIFSDPNNPSDPRNGKPIAETGAAVLGKALIGPGDVARYAGTSQGAQLLNPPPAYSSSTVYRAGTMVRQGSVPVRGGINSTIYVCVVDGTSQAPSAASPQWALFWPYDGADGPGLRTQLTIDTDNDGVADAPGGKVWAYLQPDQFKMSGVDILDRQGNPILYYPCRPARPNLTTPAASSELQPYVGRTPSALGDMPRSLVNADDNFEIIRRPGETDQQVLYRIRMMLGDYATNGYIDNASNTNIYPETPITADYVLWSAGPDGIFGPARYTQPTIIDSVTAAANQQAVDGCDDVMNTR